MLEALRNLKPSRWFLISLILLALATLAGVMLGYRPAVVGPLKPAEYADFVVSIFGVVATVVGVAVAGWVTLEQLDSEREDRSKERSLTTKHAVLIDALRGFRDMISQLSRLPNLETPHSEISQAFAAGASQTSPAWAVADLATVSLLQYLSNDVSAAFMRLGVARQPLVKLSQRGKSTNEAIQKNEEHRARLAQAEADAHAVHDFVKALQIKQLIVAQNAVIAKLRKENEEAHAEFLATHYPYALRCIFEVRRLTDRYRQLCGCVRLEVHAAEHDETFDNFCDAADLQDDRMVERIKEVYGSEHHALIESLARDAGCKLDAANV